MVARAHPAEGASPQFKGCGFQTSAGGLDDGPTVTLLRRIKSDRTASGHLEEHRQAGPGQRPAAAVPAAGQGFGHRRGRDADPGTAEGDLDAPLSGSMLGSNS